MKKIFFCGNPEIAVPALEKLAEKFEILVGTFPDKIFGRKKIWQSTPVKIAAQKLNLPIFEISNQKNLADFCAKKNFDAAIVIAFGLIFPEKILQKNNFLNVHFSLLPQFRGASPVQSAILAGEKISGISIQKMAKKLDAGDILFQKEFSIAEKNCREIFDFFAQKTAEILPNFLENFFKNKILAKKQNEKNATFCRKIEKKDGEIFPQKMSADEIFRKFLAFKIWPEIFFRHGEKIVKLKKIFLKNPPENCAEIFCKNGKIFVDRAQISGKKEMSAAEILRGNSQIFKF